MLEEKQMYTLQELFDDLPITIAELGRQSQVNEVTLARMRDGKKTRRDTTNRLLTRLSEIYGRRLTTRNVIGINVQVNKRLEKKEARIEGSEVV
jgi:predicted transcriptional regulator